MHVGVEFAHETGLPRQGGPAQPRETDAGGRLTLVLCPSQRCFSTFLVGGEGRKCVRSCIQLRNFFDHVTLADALSLSGNYRRCFVLLRHKQLSLMGNLCSITKHRTYTGCSHQQGRRRSVFKAPYMVLNVQRSIVTVRWEYCVPTKLCAGCPGRGQRPCFSPFYYILLSSKFYNDS